MPAPHWYGRSPATPKLTYLDEQWQNLAGLVAVNPVEKNSTGRWPGADREPTGKHVSCPGISRIRVQGDKILEERVYLDRLDEFGCWGAKEQKTGFKPAVGGSVGFMPIRKSN
jgi:hypothetical protein